MREFKDLKIAVAGTGYVGLSIATLLSQHHKVTAVDIIPEKVELINNKKSPIQDDYIEKYLAEKELDLTATLDAKKAYSDADFVVIAAPTNYDSKKNFFDTSAVEAVIKLVIEYNPEAIMVIKRVRFRLDLLPAFVRSITATTLSSVRSFYVRARRCTTTSIPAGSLWARMCGTPGWSRRQTPSPRCCRKEPSRRISTLCLWDSRKQRQSSCSLIHIWLCA